MFSYPANKFPAATGYVALTIDDGICRQSTDCCMAEDVRNLLRVHGATATFFLCSEYVNGFEGEVRQLISDGHELANHLGEDRGDYFLMAADKFESVLKTTSQCLEAIAGNGAVRWFRAPQGKFTWSMRAAVHRNGMRHALGDCYCDDFMHSSRPKWIAETILRQVKPGSIIIMHMPEKGHWEHTLEALKLVLHGLVERHLQPVTLSHLARIAQGTGEPAAGAPSRNDIPREYTSCEPRV